MGVCLYLALMKRLFGDRFTFALLDDVVMSVDSGHRYQFCKLLKTHFPDTQFIITTHDRLWAEQMRSAGLVTRKTSIAFHSWTIDTGPLVESNVRKSGTRSRRLSPKARSKSRRPRSATTLSTCRGISPTSSARCRQFRADGNYELGDLLQPSSSA